MPSPTDELFRALERADRVALAAGISAAVALVGLILWIGMGFAHRSGRSKHHVLWLLVASLAGLVAYCEVLAYSSTSLHAKADGLREVARLHTRYG